MALVKNISTHPLDLTDGRIVDPSDTINADLSLPHEADLVASGRLVITNPSTDPPAPATRNVPVVAPIAYTDPSTSVTLDISGEATDAEVAAAIAAIGGRFRGAYASLTSGAIVKANDVVTNPSGALVSRIADGTISGSYNSANWTALSAGGSGLPAGGTTGQVLKKNSGTDGDAGWGTAAAAGLTPTAVKTANYTAVSGDLVRVDTTGGAVTVTLPAAAAGATVGVKLTTLGGSNAVTVAAAGSDVFNKAGGSTTLTLSLLNQGVVLAAVAGVWVVQADDLALTQLDARYQLPTGGPGYLQRTTSGGTPVWGTLALGVNLIAPAPSGDTTGATDTAAIQALINQCYTAGGGTVQLQPTGGTTAPYYITQLKIRSFVELTGVSRWGTVLRAPLGQASGLHMIILYDDLTWGFALRKFTLDGQNGKGPVYGGSSTPVQANAFHGMFFDVTTSVNHFDPYGADSCDVIEDVSVVQMPHRGIVVSRAMSEMRLRGVYVISCRYTGFEISYADCFLSDCTAGANGSIGFKVTGSANQLVNCKAWWNGWGAAEGGTVNADFYVTSRGNQLENCFSQDAYSTGFYVKGNEHRIDGSVAGGNTQNLLLDAAVDCHIELTSNQQINNQTADYLVNNLGSTTGCRIILDGKAGATVADVTGSSLSGNDVQVYRKWIAGGPNVLLPAVTPESASYFRNPVLVPAGTMATAGVLVATPIVVGRDTTLAELQVNVTVAGGASSTVRLGVFADTGSFYPGARLVDAGTFSTASSGRIGATGLTQLLSAGKVYWFVAVLDGGGGTVPTVTAAGPGPSGFSFMGNNASNAGYLFAGAQNDEPVGFSQTLTQPGALPATFSTTRTQELGGSAGGKAILIAGRVA